MTPLRARRCPLPTPRRHKRDVLRGHALADGAAAVRGDEGGAGGGHQGAARGGRQRGERAALGRPHVQCAALWGRGRKLNLPPSSPPPAPSARCAAPACPCAPSARQSWRSRSGASSRRVGRSAGRGPWLRVWGGAPSRPALQPMLRPPAPICPAPSTLPDCTPPTAAPRPPQVSKDFIGHGVGRVFHARPHVQHVKNSERDVMPVRAAKGAARGCAQARCPCLGPLSRARQTLTPLPPPPGQRYVHY